VNYKLILQFFSNGNKNRYRISKRANHLQNGGQRLIKGESEVSIAKSNSVNLLDDSKCPDKTLEKCDVEKDESTILIENTLNGALNLTVNDCAKKAVNLNESHAEVNINKRRLKLINLLFFN
jgi:hypothetical protein